MLTVTKHATALVIMACIALAVSHVPIVSSAEVGAPAWLQDVVSDRLIHVDQNNPQSSDSNLGNEDFPLRSVSAGADLAMKNYERGFSTKVLIYPGVYREQIMMKFSEQKENPTVSFEAKEKGKAFISGSDIWNGWTTTDSNNVFAHPWPHRWGEKPYPPGWRGNATLESIVRRRETIYIDGTALEQVIEISQLSEGRFYVSEEEGQVLICPPAGKHPSHVVIEVGVRSGLLSIEGKVNFLLAGLVFQHDVSGIEGNAVVINRSSNVIVQDCTFQWNNWTGYRFHDSRNVTSRRNISNYNGGTGLTAWKVKNFLSEDDETSYNNWRGKAGRFYYWAVSGAKNMRIHNAVFRRHKAWGNHAAGFWLDYDNENIILEENVWCGNLKHGLFIEVSQGPITLVDSKIYNNQQWGIRSIASRFVALLGNHVFNNAGQQIFLTGPLDRAIDNWETHDKIHLSMENWTLKNNVISGSTTLLETKDWQPFLTSLRSEGNVWRKPNANGAFRIGHNPLTFSAWQSATGQDSTSSFTGESEGKNLNNDCRYKG